MKEGYVIRRGDPDDIDKIISIALTANTASRWTPSEYEEIFKTRRLLLVAEHCGEVVGFLVAHDIAGEWELENVAVEEEWRQFGIGAFLISSLINEAGQSHARFIFLEVRESNSAARRLYEKCGFEQYGRRRSYYSDPPEDALLYRFLCTPGALENC
jgi:ribosomal-protein-alanine N-acetyltransferase